MKFKRETVYFLSEHCQKKRQKFLENNAQKDSKMKFKRETVYFLSEHCQKKRQKFLENNAQKDRV